MNKIFKMLIAAVISSFSLVIANAETAHDEEQSIEKHICFKDEVPIHPGVIALDGKRVRINKTPSFIRDRQGKLLVYVSFDKEDCTKAHYDALNEKQYDILIHSINDNLVNSMCELTDEDCPPFISEEVLKTLTLDQKKERIIFANDAGLYQGLEDIFKSLSKENRELVIAIFDELRCLSDLHFFTREDEGTPYDPEEHYKISICETDPGKLIQYTKKNIYGETASKNYGTIKQSFFVIDTASQNLISENEINTSLMNELKKSYTNLLYYQIFHFLGLYDPNYFSYEEYKRYPTPSSNEDENSAIIKKCLGNDLAKISSGVCPINTITNTNEYLLKLSQCLNLQTTSTPTDVKTLHHLFGASLDNSPECKITRKKFKEKYARDLKGCC